MSAGVAGAAVRETEAAVPGWSFAEASRDAPAVGREAAAPGGASTRGCADAPAGG